MTAERAQELLCARAPVESPDRLWRWAALPCPRVSLCGPRFTCPPFLRRNKAHARAIAFVIARGLAGILKRRVAAGAVPARAHLSRKLGRISRGAAAYAGHRFCVL